MHHRGCRANPRAPLVAARCRGGAIQPLQTTINIGLITCRAFIFIWIFVFLAVWCSLPCNYCHQKMLSPFTHQRKIKAVVNKARGKKKIPGLF